MAKNWWFKFEYRVWQCDPALSQCSLGARGFWLEMIAAMYAQESYKISGSYEKIARMARCESSEVAKYAVELHETNACDVTLGHGIVTLVSRRLKRILSTKENNRLRKQKERVAEKSQNRVISNKKEVISNKKEENTQEVCAFSGGGRVNPITAEERSFTTDVLDAVRESFGLLQLSKEFEWADAALWAYVNKFTVENFVECLQLLRAQKWRSGAVRADHVVTNLPSLEKLRTEVEQQDGSTKKHQHRGRRTDAEVLAESQDFYDNYIA